MAVEVATIGVVGGSGMLGRAISHAILDQKVVAPEDFWISNRSGSLTGFDGYHGLNVTGSNQTLVDACDLIILCVPPARVPDIAVDARDSLIVSVMAGITIDRIRQITGAERVVRAMSSPAAQIGLAFSPWVASPEVDDRDRALVRAMFEACGLTDEVADEKQIECFTALTGPVPGFVAYFADCMVKYAVRQGISPRVADRAVRQLFLAGGRMMAEGPASPAEHVRQMIDYAGTTAAGLNAMKDLAIAEAIADGLTAAVERTRRMQ
jgi:pyrroline-5-carboxylate reductase